MKRVAIYIDWPDRLSFFHRLTPGLRRLGWEPQLVTNKLALHLRGRRLGLSSRLVRRPRRVPEVDLAATRELAAGVLDPPAAGRLYQATVEALRGLHAERPLHGALIWNGDDVVGAAARAFAHESGLPILFLEIANLPGRLFADPSGVNARSSIARDPAPLDRLPARQADFDRWLRDYLETKRRGHEVPQARIFERVDAVATAVSHLGFHLLRVPTDDRRSLASKVRMKRRASMRYPFDPRSPEDGEYLFFPMQVSKDTQVLLNSDLDNFDAIRRSAERAAARGLPLVVKPHPAEPERHFVDRLLELKRELGFLLVGGNTFEWLRHAAEVITINSTAGLEAMLLGRPVEFLGRSFYPQLAPPGRLARYVMSYLLEIDYFGAAEIPVDAVRRLLERLERA